MDDSIALEDSDLFTRLKSQFKADKQHSNQWRKDAIEDFDFVSGRHWKADEEQTLKEQGRPPVVFNRVQPVIDVVCGQEVSNRQEVRYIPRTVDDAALTERMTEAARWFRDQSDAEDEDSDAFRDAVICGMGWSETRYDADQDVEGLPVIERINPFEMFWDCHARRANLMDARRIWRLKKMSLSDAKALFPDADGDCLDAKWANSDEEGKEAHENNGRSYGGETKEDDTDDKQVTIVECQWHEMATAYRVNVGDQVVDATEQEALQLRVMYPGAIASPYKKRAYKRAFIGTKILEEGPAPCGDHFSFACITGKRDQNKGVWYGVVRPMKDPQRWANKWLSQAMHILSTNAKGGIFAELGAFEDIDDAEKTYAKNDQITWVTNGSLTQGKIQPKIAPPVPAGFFDLMNFAVSSVRDTSGVSVEMIGQQDNNQAASLEYQRRQTSMTILASLFDSLRRYRKTSGRLLLYIIQNMISPDRMVRITGDGDPSYQQLTPQAQSAIYDIIVDDAPTSPNQKEQVWQVIMSLAPMLKDIVPPPVWMELMAYSPLPASITSKLKQTVEKSAQEPNQPDPKMLELQAKGQLEQQKMQMQAELEAQKLDKQVEVERMQAEADIAVNQKRVEAQIMLEQVKAQASAQLAEMQFQFDQKIKEFDAETRRISALNQPEPAFIGA